MNEVERIEGQGVRGQVQLHYFQVWFAELIQEASVDVGGHYAAGRAYLITEPPCNGASAGSGIKAVPPLCDLQRLHAAEGRRVKALL